MSYAIIRNEKYKRENLKGQVKTASNKEMLLIKLLVVNFGKLKIYIQLQNAFYSYITENGFDLERGKSLSREHLSVKDYKKITNYEKSKQTPRDIKIELPNDPSIKDFGKLTVKRDERI